VNSDGKLPCRFWAAGSGCNRGKECKFFHDMKIQQPKKDKGAGKGSPGGGAQARTSSPGAKSDTPCFKWILNKCDRTAADCKFAHRKCTEVEKPAFEKYKTQEKEREAKKKQVAAAPAQPKAEAKAKAKAEAGK
jgi:hypothetical protein